MSDLISRQAAIDFIDAGHLCNPNEPRWSDNEVVNFLKSRPSAQPETHDKRTETHGVCLDAISRQAAIDALEEYADRLQMVNWKENPGVPYKAYALNWCINTIRDLPSAQPQHKSGKTLAEEVERIKRELTDIFTEQMGVQPQRMKGRWIRSEESRFRPYMCSSCGALYDVDTVFGDVTWKFCPNCGAEMRGVDDAAD